MTAGSASWQQINLAFASREAAEHTASGQLGPALLDAEAAGLVCCWFFIRKDLWRVRCLPAPGADTDAGIFLTGTAQFLVDSGQAVRWAPGIYEPETCAFGGPEAMTAAHALFHADSRHILAYLAGVGAGAGQRREVTLLLCTALMRAAGQDRYEQGDIWAKIHDLRSGALAARVPSGQQDRFTAAVDRLISVDTSPGTEVRATSLGFVGDWLTAFEHGGQALRSLSEDGKLIRGIRAVCAHHVIFHWNRIGLAATAQGTLARAAKDAVFGSTPA